jgi:hypothetical protein
VPGALPTGARSGVVGRHVVGRLDAPERYELGELLERLALLVPQELAHLCSSMRSHIAVPDAPMILPPPHCRIVCIEVHDGVLAARE